MVTVATAIVSRTAVVTAVMVLHSASLSGCVNRSDDAAEGSSTGSLSLEEAKAEAITVRDELAALYPGEDIVSVRANVTSKDLMPCGSDDEFA
jgi:hypothetical protein